MRWARRSTPTPATLRTGRPAASSSWSAKDGSAGSQAAASTSTASSGGASHGQGLALVVVLRCAVAAEVDDSTCGTDAKPTVPSSVIAAQRPQGVDVQLDVART